LDADVAPSSPPLHVGAFAAFTKIRTRSLPDVASAPTGDAIKIGEVFEVTEVVPPAEGGGLCYLKVGTRGWVFDKGVAGNWLGKAIVERVPEVEQATYIDMLRDPEAYAEYRAIMSQPDYAKRLNDELARAYQDDKRVAGLDSDAWRKDPSKKREEVRQWQEDHVKKLEELREQVPSAFDEVPSEGEEKRLCIQEIIAQHPDLQEYRDAAEKRAEPPMNVAPKWVKLTKRSEMTEEEKEAEAEWEMKKKRIRNLPGGPETLRRKPRTWSWRMGIRVPTVCSPI